MKQSSGQIDIHKAVENRNVLLFLRHRKDHLFVTIATANRLNSMAFSGDKYLAGSWNRESQLTILGCSNWKLFIDMYIFKRANNYIISDVSEKVL